MPVMEENLYRTLATDTQGNSNLLGEEDILGDSDLTKEEKIDLLQQAGLLGVDLISPASDIKEYQQGAMKIAKGNIEGVPQVLAGLAGIFVPGSKYIRGIGKKLGQKIDDTISTPSTDDTISIPSTRSTWADLDKDIKVFHGTHKPFKESESFRTPENVLFVSPNPHLASKFTEIGGLQETGKRIYPLKISKEIVEKNIFDPSKEKHFNLLKKDPDFKQWLQQKVEGYNLAKPDKKKINKEQFLEGFRKNNFFPEGNDIDTGAYIEDIDLQPILQKLNFEGFTIKEGQIFRGSKNIGVFLDPKKGDSKILRYLYQKYGGGMVMKDYNKNYNTQRTI